MNLEKGANFIWKNARLLERVIFEHYFFNGPATRILEVLRTYQNDDGGFGHALEPDLRAPDSQPLFAEFALRTLYECNIHASEITYNVCNYLSKIADIKKGIPTIFASAKKFPRALHWNNPLSEQSSLDRMIGVVGLASWQGIQHPWLNKAVDVCLENIALLKYDDAHTILNAFCLIESISDNQLENKLFSKLSDELLKADFFRLELPVRNYGLTPLDFAPTPDSYCRKMFTESQIEAHLNELEAKQETDGGWPIQWEPPSDMAIREWRSYKTMKALITLHAYGRI